MVVITPLSEKLVHHSVSLPMPRCTDHYAHENGSDADAHPRDHTNRGGRVDHRVQNEQECCIAVGRHCELNCCSNWPLLPQRSIFLPRGGWVAALRVAPVAG